MCRSESSDEETNALSVPASISKEKPSAKKEACELNGMTEGEDTVMDFVFLTFFNYLALMLRRVRPLENLNIIA